MILRIENAANAANHLREQIAANAFTAPDVYLAVTASFGVSGWKGEIPAGSTLDALISKCDAGVYASKDAGRDRVTVDPMD